MPDSKYFGIPFATSGDRAPIPEASQPSGSISFTQGFGPDYERNPATDPVAKRVPRDETNEYLFQITNAIKFLQLYGLPEWYAVDGSGNPVAYPVAARVRHNNAAYVSLVNNNTQQPGAGGNWVLNDISSTTTQRGLVELATLEETSLGTDATRAVTPAGLAPLVTSGSRQTKAFTSSVAVSDINPNTPTVVQTVSISGTRYIDAFGALAFRNSATAANTCQAVMWLRLAGGPQEEYIGCAVPGAAAVQIPLSSRRIFQGLNRNSTYALQLCALKPVPVGPLNVMDTLIVANHE